MKRKLSLIAAAVLSSMLTACGGGSDGEQSGPDGVTPPPPPPPAVTDVVTTITPANYPVGSEEAAAFETLNNERLRCGFGTLKQNSSLDTAALAHANWILANGTFSHIETPDKPNFFTGATYLDRIYAAGYPRVVGGTELIAPGFSPSKAGRGHRSVRELLATPYHAYGALMPARDVGISVRSPLDLGRDSLIPVAVFELATDTGYQIIESSDVATYPCDGTAGVDYKMGDELPNPVPGRNLNTNPLGHAISVMVRFGNILTIDNAELVNTATQQSVVLRTPVTAVNDPNGTFASFGRHAGYVIADAPLSPNAEYQATLRGTNNGVPFTKTFRFTTGEDAAEMQ